jgi:hypothetical protein
MPAADEVQDLVYDEEPSEFDANEVKEEISDDDDDDADDDGLADTVWLEQDEYAEHGWHYGKRRRL